MTNSDKKDRVVLHCDCNSFFASVETAMNPAYRGVPMAVCGDPELRKGIVLAKNELAKKAGIQTAETVFSAKKKCPELVIASPHFAAYAEYSRRVRSVYEKYTDMVESFGMDECWLDVTASEKLFGSGREIAEKIRSEIKNSIGITVSIGVSFNKVFAKFGSDYKKPDAVTEITRENYKKIIWPKPVGALLFVGKRSETALNAMGIFTIGDLASAPLELLMQRFGKMGEQLYLYANGEDESPVCELDEDQKSVSNGLTFRHDLQSFSDCRSGIDYLCEEIGTKLRKKGLLAQAVALTIKDPLLHTFTRQKVHKPATDVGKEIADAAYRILTEEWKEEYPIRMLTVTAMNLIPKVDAGEQLTLFDSRNDEKAKKKQDSEIAVDNIRQKYGGSSILKASVLGSDFGILDEAERNSQKKAKK